MEQLRSGRAGVVLREERGRYAVAAVEGSDQCSSCRRFMRLGEARLCLGPAGDFEGAAEIVGWVPGKCAQFEKAESPF